MGFSCTDRSAMNHIVAPRPVEPAVSDFYRHPYGGIARDIFVTREGFMRFFNLREDSILIAESFAGQGKLYDTVSETHETMGYINLFPGGKMTYMVTIIDRSVKARYKFLERSAEKVAKEFVDVMKGAANATISFRSALPHSAN